MPARAAVLYVHGLWMVGVEAVLLRRRLWRERGYGTHVFRYGSVHEPLAQVLAQLRATLAGIRAQQVHLIGHSLGGALIVHYLERYTLAQPGRVVFIGAPVQGSRSAQRLGRWRLGRQLLGHGAAELLQSEARRWPGPRELGVIAGTASIGFGRLLQRFEEPNDGTVALSETRLPGAKAYLDLPVTHMGLVFSATVAREAGSFLQYGCFGR